MKGHFCMPTRMRASRKNTRLSPMSLLDRFRDAVFRLIMISALSRPSNTDTTSFSTSASTYDDSPSPLRLSSRSSSKLSSPAAASSRHHHRSFHHYSSSNSHHTEAVADCIEFIKRSAKEEINRDSSAISNISRSSRTTPVTYDHKSAEIVIPLPVNYVI